MPESGFESVEPAGSADLAPPRVLIRRIAAYSGEQVIRLGLALIAGIVVARALGPAQLGLLTFAGAMFTVGSVLVALGFPNLLTREFSTQENRQVILASALTYQIPTALGVGIIGFGLVSSARGWEVTATLTAAALAPIPVLAVSETLRTYLQAMGRAREVVVAGIVSATTGAPLRMLAAVLTGSPAVVAGAVTVEAVVRAVLTGRAFRPGRLTRTVRLSSTRVGRGLLRESWPLLIASFAVMIYQRVDMLMLGVLAGDAETGIYAAAVRLSEAWYVLPTTAMAALRPQLTRLLNEGRHADYLKLTSMLLRGLIALSYIAILIVTITAPWIIRVLFGGAFDASASVLRIHILAGPFIFLTVGSSQWFIDKGLTRKVLLRASVGALLNVTLNLVLIPAQGADGAAIATLVSYAVSAWLVNASHRDTDELFRLQARSLLLLPGRSS